MQQRLALASAALREHLPGFEFALPQGGGSIWVRAPVWLDAAELSLAARGHGVLIEAGDVFFMNPPDPCPYFRLRLSSIAAGSIAAGIKALGLAVAELAQVRGEARANPSSAFAATSD
jgi:GntR family transcriptional regulator / MocR family aminotransferase